MMARLVDLALGLVTFVTLTAGVARADVAPPEPEKDDGGCAAATDDGAALAVVGALALGTIVVRRRARASA